MASRQSQKPINARVGRSLEFFFNRGEGGFDDTHGSSPVARCSFANVNIEARLFPSLLFVRRVGASKCPGIMMYDGRLEYDMPRIPYGVL
jgi:hypothetical protein